MADEDIKTGDPADAPSAPLKTPASSADAIPQYNTPVTKPTQPAQTPTTPTGSVPASTPTQPIASYTLSAEVGLPARAPAPPLPTPSPTGNLQADVAHILEAVKLPERNVFRASADKLAPAPPVQEAVIIEETIKPAPIRADSQTNPAIPPPAKQVSPVHTLKDDLKTAVHDKNLSLVQAAALEENKRSRREHAPEERFHPQPHPRITRALIFAGILVVLGGLALGTVFLVMRDRNSQPGAEFVVESLLFSEQTIPLSLQKRSAPDIKRLLAEARTSSGLSLGVITRITPLIEEQNAETQSVSEREVTTREFFTAIGAHAPEDLLRALSSEFFFGLHTVDENAPLIIVPVTSYERAFAGMLTWEKTLNADLAPVFTRVTPLIRTGDGLLIERSFEDAVMRNYDARILRDDAGVIQLYYSFPTRELLIISESPYSFAEILARLRAERKL